MPTLYLWDIANTIVVEKWDKIKSGFETYDQYLLAQGFDLATIKPLQYEINHCIPYTQGLYNLSLPSEVVETLAWTKNNILYTTGVKEQFDWRAQQLVPKYKVDLRDYISEIICTFDFEPINLKKEYMFMEIFDKIRLKGFDCLVYTDDKLEYCNLFYQAAVEFNKKHSTFKYATYNILQNDAELKVIKENFYQIGHLRQLKNNEEVQF